MTDPFKAVKLLKYPRELKRALRYFKWAARDAKPDEVAIALQSAREVAKDFLKASDVLISEQHPIKLTYSSVKALEEVAGERHKSELAVNIGSHVMIYNNQTQQVNIYMRQKHNLHCLAIYDIHTDKVLVKSEFMDDVERAEIATEFSAFNEDVRINGSKAIKLETRPEK